MKKIMRHVSGTKLEVYASSILLLASLLFLFDFFSPRLESGSSIFDRDYGVASAGLNTRSIFWIVVGGIVFYFGFTRKLFHSKEFLKSYFTLITLFVTASIAWSEYPDVTFVRVVLWILSGGSISILYLSAYRNGHLKGIFLTLSAMLLVINLIVIILYPSGAISSGGTLTGIHVTKNTMGAVAAFFSLLLFALIYEFDFKNAKLKGLTFLMMMMWFGFLILSGSKSSIAFTVILVFAVFFLRWRTKFVIYISIATALIMLCIVPLIFYLSGYDAFKEYAQLLPPEILTGRGMIWSYVMEEFDDFFWLGVGYRAYWSTGEIREIFDLEFSFLQVLNSSHNGYIHVFTNLGVVGLTFFLLITLFKIYKFGNEMELWELAVVCFIVLNCFLETSFMTDKNIWLLFVAILTRLEFEK
jgi:O-antigen ligase